MIDVRAEERIGDKDAEVFAATVSACASVGWDYRRVGTVDAVLTANVRCLAGENAAAALTFLAGAEEARRRGSPELLARAAIALDMLSGFVGSSGPEVVEPPRAGQGFAS